MMYQVTIDDTVYADLEEISSWYDKQAEKLGEKFLNQFYDSIEVLKSSPLIYQICFDNVRKLKINRFSYMVYYEVKQNTVLIIAVFHGKKDPTSTFSEISNRHKLTH